MDFVGSSAAAYGLVGTGPVTNQPSELHAMATPFEGEAEKASLTSLRNPLTWFAILAAGALGLAAVSTTVRVGPASASFGVGKK